MTEETCGLFALMIGVSSYMFTHDVLLSLAFGLIYIAVFCVLTAIDWWWRP